MDCLVGWEPQLSPTCPWFCLWICSLPNVQMLFLHAYGHPLPTCASASFSACVGVLSRRLLDNMAQPPWLGWKKKVSLEPFPRSSFSKVINLPICLPKIQVSGHSSDFFHSPTHPWWSKGSCGLVVISMNNRKLYKWPINKMFYMNGQLVMCTYIDLKAFTLMLTD